MTKVLNYIEAKDTHHSPIILNTKLVHFIDKNTIQVEQHLLNKWDSNTLYILYRKAPVFVTAEKTIQEQYVDIPISLLEPLITGLAYFAHSIGVISQDSMKYGIAIDKYLERYEKSIQRALAYQLMYPQNTKDEAVKNSCFF